jgi:hypothetical protein
MEASSALRGSGISKRMVAFVIVVLAAFMLGAGGGYAAKTLSLPRASVVPHILIAQDGASGPGSAWNYSSRRSGTQAVGGPAPATLSAPARGASFREPGTGRGGPQS